MPALLVLLVLTFVESLATLFFENGVYFYTHERLAFGERANLALAVVFGLTYVLGALGSHVLSARLGERRTLAITIFVQLLGMMVMTIPGFSAASTTGVVFAMSMVMGLLNGIKWPVVESYIGAGRTGSAQAAAVGRFNVSWSLSAPVALLVIGPLIAAQLPGPLAKLTPGSALFLAGVAASAVSLFLLIRLPARVTHTAADHPQHPAEDRVRRFRALLASSRWSMFVSYAMMFVILPLAPSIFAALGHSVSVATALTAVLYAVRCAVFLVMERTERWHGSALVPAVVVFVMPVGFFLVLLGPSTAITVVGLAVFGVAAGLAYAGALYYAIVVGNASVDAGGKHEAIIGLGFTLGPALGVAGKSLGAVLGGATAGLCGGVLPLIVFCGGGALWSLRGVGPDLRPQRRRSGLGQP
jgi:Na+/melibiose symporter-like transporter